MMKKYFSAIIITICISVFISCVKKSKHQDCGDPAPFYCMLSLVDADNNYLLGKKYFEDSIKLSVDQSTIELYFSDSIIYFYYEGLEKYNESDYMFELNSEEIDTLNLTVRDYITECWEGSALEGFRLNREEILPTGSNNYMIEK